MTADVVIVNWQAAELTLRCLEHLKPECESIGARLIVVDNASTDGSAALIAERFPDVDVLVQEENLGFGRAVNVGAAAGTGEAIVLINNDLFVGPGCLAALLMPLEENAQVGMVAGLALQPAGTGGEQLVDGFGVELDRTLTAYNRLRHRSPHAPGAGVLAGPSGGLAAYRRSAFGAVGGFDDRLFAYAEDVDLALRLRLAGWSAAEAVQATGVHLGGATTGVDSPQQRHLAGFGRGFLIRRYGVLRSRAALRAIVFELLIVLWGMVRHRTLVPLTSRVAGWRAAKGDRLTAPPLAITREISAREQLRRARTAR